MHLVFLILKKMFNDIFWQSLNYGSNEKGEVNHKKIVRYPENLPLVTPLPIVDEFKSKLTEALSTIFDKDFHRSDDFFTE